MSATLRKPQVWLLVLIVASAALLPLGVSGYILGLLTVAYYFGVFSMAWDLLFGFANEVNFGPTFLVGLGAYTAGIVDNRYGLPIPVCVALGTLAAVVGGIVLALPALRMSGPYFGLTTLVAVLLLQNLVVLITKHLKKGERIRIAGLGILQVRKRAARMGRNPATGEAIKIKASKKVAFRAAKDLKEAI